VPSGSTVNPEASRRPRYIQPSGKPLRIRLVHVILLTVLVVSASALSFLIAEQILTQPNQPTTLALVPLLVWFAILYMADSGMDQLTRSSLIVYDQGFVPPYRKSSLFSPRLPLFVSFAEVIRVWTETYPERGEQRVREVAFELGTGARISVAERIVGQIGMIQLMSAWTNAPRGSGLLRGASQPRWIEQQARDAILLGSLILGIAVVSVTILLFPSRKDFDPMLQVAWIAIMALVAVLGLVDIRAARRWARETTKITENP